MAKQVINIGTAVNSGNGDPIRTAFNKANDNFTELYNRPVFSGSYNDLTNKPSLFSGNYADLTNKPTLFSGDYNDLNNKPRIPTDVSDLTDNTNLLGSGANLGLLKISGSTVGTQGENNSWGGSWLYLDPAGEGWSGISIPSSSAQNSGGELTIYNNKETSGAIKLLTYGGSWNFNNNGELQFPDGTIQTTAYVSETPISKYVAVNDNGVISGSDDGNTWNEYDSPLNGINRVAVGPNKIVYIANSSNGRGNNESLWYADTYDTEPTEVTSLTTRNFSEVKYFKSISKFIAVGNDGAGNPGLYYSDDGITWSESYVDPTYLATIEGYNGASFADIAENQLGFFVISNNTTLGGFFLGDITDTLDGNNHVNLSSLPSNPDDIAWVDSLYFSGWHLITENNQWCYNNESNPTVGTFQTDFITLNSTFESEIGIQGGDLVEYVAGEYNGMSVIMISTNAGQIVYWPTVPAGPYVSIPKPFTATITDWTSSATSAITYTAVTGTGSINEKFIVTGSSVSGYNGTYYLGADGGVFTDRDLTFAFDTTGLDPFTGTATISWSHGQFIDALHYNNGVFYAGNDNEELFKSINGGQSWTQVDQLGGGQGESDGYLNDIDSYISNANEITFNGIQIRGKAKEGKYGLIKLVPNTSIEGHSFLENGQFVQIYPTISYDAPHIHIAAGVGGVSEGDIFLGDDNKYVQVNHNGYVSIQTQDPETNSTNNWGFNTDGSMQFPWIETNIHNGGNQYAQTLKFGTAGQQVIITGPTPEVNTNAERIIIQGQRGLGTGEGGDVYLWGGDAEGTNGGDIKIYAGDADQNDAGSGGYVNIDGGRGFNYGGHVEITGGASPGGVGGNVSIRSGNGSTSSNNGSVFIEAGGNSWQFNNAGVLTLPSGGDIKNSSGVSVLGNKLRNILTINTAGSTVLTSTNDVVFCDTNAAGDIINVQFPETADTGKAYTIKHINGSSVVYVQPQSASQGIEWGGAVNTGSYATLNVGDCITWIFDGSAWRSIGGF